MAALQWRQLFLERRLPVRRSAGHRAWQLTVRITTRLTCWIDFDWVKGAETTLGQPVSAADERTNHYGE